MRHSALILTGPQHWRFEPFRRALGWALSQARRASLLVLWPVSLALAQNVQTPITTSVSGGAPFTCPFCDLSNAQFAGKDLTNANLQGANLSGANLRGAVLNGAMLARANLSQADLSDAQLGRSSQGHADLSAANLSGVTLKGAKLDGANLQYTDLQSFSYTGVDVSTALIVRLAPSDTRSSTSHTTSHTTAHTSTNTSRSNITSTNASTDTVACGAANLLALTSRVYVAPSGTDSATCGSGVADACASISTGVSRCHSMTPSTGTTGSSTTGCGVLVMYGEYKPPEPIALKDGINLYGGCVAGPSGNPAIQSLVNAPPNGLPAMSAGSGVTQGVVVQGFRLQGSTAAVGHASTALLLTSSRGVQLIDSLVLAGMGGPGAAGVNGTAGQAGVAAVGATAGVTAQCTLAMGGNGSVVRAVSVDVGAFNYSCKVSCSSNSCDGYGAAMGATGGISGADNCTECPSSRGRPGASGSNGRDATCGTGGSVSPSVFGVFQSGVWVPGVGGHGGSGATGGGGGGGGAGGYKAGSCFWVKTEDNGNQGGGGGSGGCPGQGGSGGQQGGASFGITLNKASMGLTNTPIVGGRGGQGGPGGDGGRGGNRGSGAAGFTNQGGGYGGTGGTGGAGGAAAGGAGGNGGPAINIALLTNASIADAGTVYYTGQSGTPGPPGTGGPAITSGVCAGDDGALGVLGTVAVKQLY